MALGFLARTESEYLNQPVVSDSLPFQDRGGPTIASIYRDLGVNLIQGDTSRIPGWSQIRSRLNGVVIDSNEKDSQGKVVKYPLLYVCESCEFLRRSFPSLARHKSETKREDATESGEATHATDTIRLICNTNKIIMDAPIPDKVLFDRTIKNPKNVNKSIRDILPGIDI